MLLACVHRSSPLWLCTSLNNCEPLSGVAGRPAASSEPFVDVDSADYFADPVAWAYNNGITAGTSADHFSPDAACLRAQIITFMALYFAE